MQVSITDRARVKDGGYKIERINGGWTLAETADPIGYLMIGSHGCVSPTQWEAYAEAIKRIEQDNR